MEHMDHTKYSGEEYCFHGGTGAANALTLAAGEATIQTLRDEPVYDRIDRLGERARTELAQTFNRVHLAIQVTGIGSLFAIHFTRQKKIQNMRHLSDAYKEQSKRLFAFLLSRGILIMVPESLHAAVSYAHTEDEIDALVSCVEEYSKAHTR